MEKDSARVAIKLGSDFQPGQTGWKIRKIPCNQNGISTRGEKWAWTYTVILFSGKQYQQHFSPAVILINGCGFSNHSKSWIQLHSIFGSCFKSAICIQNLSLLESAPIVVFSQWLKEEKILHQKGLRMICTPWSSILRPPKHWFVFSPFYFKSLF